MLQSVQDILKTVERIKAISPLLFLNSQDTGAEKYTHGLFLDQPETENPEISLCES